MASQSLYRKWRSQTFADLIGQEAVTRTLLNSVREGRLAHAYLFCGPRGTGKTSAARLLAKAINCANPQNGEPCNECISCREIASGTSPDVVEIDAASNNGVDNIRDLRSNAGLLASGGHHKVYVVDECHMLSPQAFNALLKTLEEPPPHVIFVLATTEIQKLLATVVSRCQRFDFRRITSRDIIARLNHVAQGEGLDLDPAAAELLARAAQGGMRDALSLLDQAMAYCGTRVDLARTREMLGLSDTGTLRAILRTVADQHAAEGLELIDSLVTAGADLRQVQQQMAEEWRGLMLARAGTDLTRVLDCSEDEAREIKELAQAFSLDELMACARVFAKNEAPARGLPVPQLALEIAYLECVSIRQHGGAPAQAEPPAHPRPARPEESHTNHASHASHASHSSPAPAARMGSAPAGHGPAHATSAAPTPEPRHERAGGDIPPLHALPSTPPAEHAEPESDLTPTSTPTSMPTLHLVPNAPTASHAQDGFGGDDEWGDVSEDGDFGAPPLLPSQDETNVAALINPVRQEWEMIRKVCKQKSAKVSGLLNNAHPARVEAGTLPVLIIQADHEFHYNSLRKPESIQVIEWAIQQILDRQMRVRFELAGSDHGGGSLARSPRTSPPGTPGGGLSPQRGPDASGSYGLNGHNGHNGHNGYAGKGRGPASGPANTAHGDLPASNASNASHGASGAGSTIRESHLAATEGGGARSAYASPSESHGTSSTLAATQPRPQAAAVSAVAPAPLQGGQGGDQPAARGNGNPRQAALEAEVRADPLVQELMRVCRVELAEVLPLDDEEEAF